MLRSAKYFIFTIVLAFFSLTLIVSAQSTTITLNDPASVGSAGIATADQAYVGLGSWANSGAKFNLYLTPESLFGYGVALTDIADISYHTYKETAQNGLNFYINIYTNPDGVNDDAGWYGHRITFEPLYAGNFSDIVNAWNTWSTSAGTNNLRALDSNHTNFGFYNGPTLADLQSGPLDWGNYPTSGSSEVIDYSGETINYFVIDTGSGWTADFEGYVDGFTITLVSGASVTVDLDYPLTVDQCRNGGWQALGFRNQGQCISTVNSNRGGN